MPTFTIIIPTLNARDTLTTTLENVRVCFGNDCPVLVVDAGSTDGTLEIAKGQGAEIMSAPRGRGVQLRAATMATATDWVLIIHADTRFSPEAGHVSRRFMRDPANQNKLGHFRFRLDDTSDEATKLEARVAWRCRMFALPYGDQGFLIARETLEALGGIKAIPLMEDVDLVWRVQRRYGQNAIVQLDADAITSAQKFQKSGYFKRSAKNLFCLLLFRIGVPPRFIAQIY